MIKKFCNIVIFIIISFTVLAQEQHEEWVLLYFYEGVIGDNKINIEISMLDNDVSADDTEGSYFYSQDLKDIPVKGKIDGQKIFLNEYDLADEKVVAIFNGYFLKHAPEYGTQTLKHEVIEGEWSKLDGSENKKFRVTLTGLGHIIKGENRYSVAGFDDPKTVELVAQEFKKAVLAKDKVKVASLVNYPIYVAVKGKGIKIKNQKTFITLYDEIFNRTFYDEIQNSIPHNMASNWRGVRLGHGYVWFNDMGGKVKITTINNDSTAVWSETLRSEIRKAHYVYPGKPVINP